MGSILLQNSHFFLVAQNFLECCGCLSFCWFQVSHCLQVSCFLVDYLQTRKTVIAVLSNSELVFLCLSPNWGLVWNMGFLNIQKGRIKWYLQVGLLWTERGFCLLAHFSLFPCTHLNLCLLYLSAILTNLLGGCRWATASLLCVMQPRADKHCC